MYWDLWTRNGREHTLELGTCREEEKASIVPVPGRVSVDIDTTFRQSARIFRQHARMVFFFFLCLCSSNDFVDCAGSIFESSSLLGGIHCLELFFFKTRLHSKPRSHCPRPYRQNGNNQKQLAVMLSILLSFAGLALAIFVYLPTLLWHKFGVWMAGRRLNRLLKGTGLSIPHRRLVCHDWSKFTLAELLPYARYYFDSNLKAHVVGRMVAKTPLPRWLPGTNVLLKTTYF